MNVLFMSLADYESIKGNGIYTDLLRKFEENGHHVFVISPVERKNTKKPSLIYDGNTTIIKPRIGNFQKTANIEKAISMITIEPTIISCIKKYLRDVRIDLVLFPTPPITFAKAVAYIKKRDNSFAYLMLKDIFPVGALDLGALSRTGVKGVIYRYFRRKEKYLYKISDKIGCMSKGNIEYLISHNSGVSEKVELCPNTIDPVSKRVTREKKIEIRKQYGIPIDRRVFVYGGNLGKPQGIPFLIECIKSQKNNYDVFFLIIGDGTEYEVLYRFFENEKPQNAMLKKGVAKDEYDRIMASCDVGMIFLNHCFTIPNIPSRMLSYMQASLPVLAVTDTATDLKEIIEQGQFGWWCESNSISDFSSLVKRIGEYDLQEVGNNSFRFLNENYSTVRSYSAICNAYNKRRMMHDTI